MFEGESDSSPRLSAALQREPVALLPPNPSATANGLWRPCTPHANKEPRHPSTGLEVVWVVALAMLRVAWIDATLRGRFY